MPSSDIQAKRIAATGSLAVGPARVRQVQVVSAASGSPRLTVTDGNGGSTVLDLSFSAGTTTSVNIPADGIRCASDVYVSVFTDITAVTVFYS
jgi:hypothetical protein